MPSFITHGIMGYVLFGYQGLIMGIMPDIIGLTRYFYNLLFIHKTIDFNKPPEERAPLDKMDKLDWLLYNITHSLIIWGLIYILFRKKYIFAAIISIIMDIFLHSKNIWVGPAFLYPLSDYRFDGIHWYNEGLLISFIILIIMIYQKKNIIKIIP